MILLDLNCNRLFNIQILLCFIPQRTTFCPKRRISDSFSTMFCVLYVLRLWSACDHVTLVKLKSLEYNQRLRPHRDLHVGFSLPPRSGRVQTCNKVYESTVRSCERIAGREEKRWESGKPESSEWRGISVSPTAVTPEVRGIQAANCNPNKQLLS